jgi:NADH-quinone oxidoreductase subunit E
VEGAVADDQTPHTDEDEPRDRGVSGGDRPAAGVPYPDQIGREGAAGDTVAPPGGGAPAVTDQPDTGDLSGRPAPAGSEGATRTDLPPNVTQPSERAGWDRAADLWKDPAVVPDLAETYVPAELRAPIEDAMAKYPDRRSAVLPALHAAQAVHGWCSPEALLQVAAVMQVTPAYLSSIASFYDMLNEEPVGRHHVYVCTGVACSPRHPRPVLEAIEAEAERTGLEDTEIRSFECLGACDMAPMASIDGRYVGPLDTSDAPAIVDAIRSGERPLPGRGLEDSDYRLPWGGRA